MKRYRVINFDLDSRAQILDTAISDSWEPEVQETNKSSLINTVKELIIQYGAGNSEQKIRNFRDMKSAPLSIIAYHNKFLSQVRSSFVVGSYYPALTGACALGERILNHLIINLREKYQHTKEYKKVYDKSSFANWHKAIDILESWDVLLPEVIQKYRELSDLRNQSIHFDPSTDANDRDLALEAIRLLSFIIREQFSGFGNQPWFIPNIKGVSFIKKEAETNPFVEVVYLPNCALVGPYHRLELTSTQEGIVVKVVDTYQYEEKEISDSEFAELYTKKA